LSRPCPLCGSTHSNTLRTMRYALFDDSHLPRTTWIDQCAVCGFVFANSEATAQDYAHHYQSNSIYAATQVRPGGGQEQFDRDRLNKVVQRISAQLSPEGLLVDVGAGGGGLLHCAREYFNCQLAAVDPDPACVQNMASAGFDAHLGTLNQLPVALLGKASVVTLCHVLEHVWEPVADVRHALTLLAPGGCLYLETPDSRRYQDFPNVPFYYFDPEHINHFDVDGLKKLADQTGCRCLTFGEDVIQLPNGGHYPICWAVIKPDPAASTGAGLAAPDVAPVAHYAESQEAEMAQVLQSARAQMNHLTGPVLVWGTGSQAQRMLAEGVLPTERITAFMDSDASRHGRTLLGLPVMQPQEAMTRFPDLPVLVLAARSAAAAIGTELQRRWPTRPAQVLGVSLPAEGKTHA